MSLLRAFRDFWTVPIRAESLALFRILLGLAILGNQLTGIGRTLSVTCGPDGLCPIEASDGWLSNSGRFSLLRGPAMPGHPAGSFTPFLGDWLPDWLVKDYPRLDHLQNWISPGTAEAWDAWGARLSSHYLLFAIYLVALVCMTIGFRTRLAILVALLLAATFHHRLAELMNGGDSLFRNGLYFLLLSPAGAVWSVDHLLRRRRARARGDVSADDPVLVAPWSVRLMQIQVCCMYLFTGLAKLGDSQMLLDFFKAGCDLAVLRGDSEWGDYLTGESLYWVFNDLALTRWPYAWLPIPLFVCRLMTWGTLAFELGFSFLVWFRPLRRWVLLAGVGLHLGILVTMEIGWFSQITLCWYVLFVSGESVQRFVERLGRWLRGRPAVAVPAAAMREAEVLTAGGVATLPEGAIHR